MLIPSYQTILCHTAEGNNIKTELLISVKGLQEKGLGLAWTLQGQNTV
jgi:hypothetical protein